jgi:hypothetical protein
MMRLFEQVNALDVEQLAVTIQSHDKRFAQELAEMADFDRTARNGSVLGGFAVLLTLLSLGLIGFREHHQTPRARRA